MKPTLFQTIALGILLLTTLCQADEPSRYSELVRIARNTGSRLAYTQAQMLAQKHNLAAKLESIQVSSTGIAGQSLGIGAQLDTGYAEILRVFSGGVAIDETLQLDSIDALRAPRAEREIPVSQVSPLKVKTHPWERMLEELPSTSNDISEIMELVPRDHFVIHFSQARKLRELELALETLGAPFVREFGLRLPTEISRNLAAELGIEDIFTTGGNYEIAFVSEDLAFHPSTHYALILLPRGRQFRSFPSNSRSGKVGSYYVAATSEKLYQRIRGLESEQSMAKSLDFQYAHAAVDSPRDGFLYLSEAFILKLVSPQYRVNAARRLDAIGKLASAQYLVWSYRILEGEWPRSFADFSKNGYSAELSKLPDLKIDNQGVVRHSDWGSLWTLKPLSEVSIASITKTEKEAYDRFRDGYQERWRTFFDPIGIGMEVRETLRFHTIILPLIDQSDYRQLAEIASGELIEFDSLGSLAADSPISVHSHLNFEDLLLRTEGLDLESESLDREKAKQKINREANHQFRADPPIDVFSVLGNEVFGTLVPNAGFPYRSPEDNFILGVELQQASEVKRAALSLFDGFEEKSHAGSTYYIVPFIFNSKLYVVLEQDYAYVAGAEYLARKLLENRGTAASGSFLGQDEIGVRHHALVRSDFRNNQVLAGLLGQEINSWNVRRPLGGLAATMVDRAYLKEQLGEKTADLLIPSPPEQYLGLSLQEANKEVFLEGVSLPALLSGPTTNADGKTISLGELVKSEKVYTELVELSRSLKWLTIGLQFTPEGLSTRVVLNNPIHKANSWFD